ncbi:MAG: hypothetical protein LQ337_001057 [Flavoplaca oasis]|nr:MAG: hypothetical protein LQ337_001057 [Flavoplaca oasis]
MSTASKWFVPEDEYLASTEDYAVVGESALFVKNHLIDNPAQRLASHLAGISDPNFHDILYHRLHDGDPYRSRGGAIIGPQLVYADVDRDNEEHQRLVKDAAIEGLVDEDSNDIKKASRKLTEFMHRHCPGCLDSVEGLSESEREELEAAIEKDKEDDDEQQKGPSGYMSEMMIEYVLQLEKEEDRRQALTVISGQGRRRNPRPVLLLLNIIYKVSEGGQEGWLIGYNFYANNIIIKPFQAKDGTQHPLAESWNVELPEDGVSWKGRPTEFIYDKLFPLNDEIAKNKVSDAAKETRNETYGFKLLAYYSIGDWLRLNSAAIMSIKPTEGEIPLKREVQYAVSRCCGTIEMETEKVPFPHCPEASEEGSIRSKSALKYMETLLEDYEMDVREQALEAKKAGKEDVAQNVAKLYENLLEQLRSFNMNPEKPL